MRFIQWWKPVFLSLLIVAVPFIIWDIIFTQDGIWGFNELYYLDFTILGLPLEEMLFFICIPYACVFTHYALIHFFPKVKLPRKGVKIINLFLLLFSIIILYISYPKAYTSCTFLLFAVLVCYAILSKDQILSRFYISFLIILIPFFIVNGILTGSFIEDEVVWYNNAENLGIRLGTIPIEDIFYAFDLLYLNLIVFEKLKPKFSKILS